MYSAKSTDHLAFLARHFTALAEQHGHDGAWERLAAELPPQYGPDIERLRAMLAGEAIRDTTLGLSPFATLAQLMRAAGDQRQRLLEGFVEYVQQSRAVYDTFFTGIIGLLWYLATVIMAAVVTSAIYGFAVYPQLARLLYSTNTSPPWLGRIMFESGSAWVGMVLLLALLGLAAIATLMFYRRSQQLRPLPQVPAWVPGVGRLCHAYNHDLWLHFAQLLARSGLSGADALERAAALSVGSATEALSPGLDADDDVAPQLAIAKRLGTVDAELSAQCDEHLGRLSMALLTARERLSLVLKLALFLYVGTLVIAMYLPIFKSSSVF